MFYRINHISISESIALNKYRVLKTSKFHPPNADLLTSIILSFIYLTAHTMVLQILNFEF